MLIALAKFVPVPTYLVFELLSATKLPGAGTLSALVAIAFVLAGVFMFGTMKTRADESERLMHLAREEASIERERSERLESENAVLRAQPNLEKHAQLMEKMLDKSDVQIDLLREIRTATVPPS